MPRGQVCVRSGSKPPLVILVALLLGGFVTAPARGDECATSWTRPFICGVEVRVAEPGERARQAISLRDVVELPVGGSRELEVRGVDQRGTPFPVERSGFALEVERECRNLVTVADLGSGRFRLSAGNERGRCGLVLWVPGNLNLEWPIRVEVKPVASEGYTRAQAERIANKLYRAILGRDADPGGLAAAAAEVQRGRLSSQVESMFRSGEFMGGRKALPANELLEGFYQGLLGRGADSAGVRRYLGEVERGRFARVVLDIIRSEEFESQLLQGVPLRR